MFCDEHLPFSLCSSILLIVAISLESVPLVIGLVLMTVLTNIQVHSYTIPLEEEKEKEKEKEKEPDDKHTLACKQKYKCENFVNKSVKYTCLLKDGTFDEAGYKLLGDKVYCPMCYSVVKKQIL
jgi:hypothetical protein